MKEILKSIEFELGQNSLFDLVAELAEETGLEVYVVGGYIRDIILSRISKDIDFVVIGNAMVLAERITESLGREAKLTVFPNFGTANIRFREHEYEFVGARKESYRKDSRKPEVSPGTLDDDLSRRDFTINALAVSLNKSNYGMLIDRFNGVHDISKEIIRTPLDPDTTFSDDPLRMMRAIRFASQLYFEIDDITFRSIIKNADRLSIISMERISDELNKILMSGRPSVGLKLLDEAGILNMILPEVVELKGTESVDNKTHKDNFNHTLQVVDNVADLSENLWLRWTALLHDIGKPVTKNFDPVIGWTFHTHDYAGAKMVSSIFNRLRLPLNEKMKYVKKLVMLHLRPVSLTKDEVTDSAVRRLIVDAGDDIDDLLMLCKADITSKNQVRAATFKQRFDAVKKKIRDVEEKDALRNWKNPITGEIIMEALQIPPGKEIGILKDAVKEAIMDGIIKNDFDEAYKYMLKVATDMDFIKKV